MNNQPNMTPEYIRLSLHFGLLGGSLFEHGVDVRQMIRDRAWTLTPEYLEEIRKMALNHGLSQAELQSIEHEVNKILHHPRIIEMLQRFQYSVDTKARALRQ